MTQRHLVPDFQPPAERVNIFCCRGIVIVDQVRERVQFLLK